jgi:hypothetical protein
MPRKKLRVVSLDEVRITRRGHTVEFEYADEGMGGMSLHVGVDVGAMSDDEPLEKHNRVRRTRDEKVLLRLPVYRLRVTLAGTEPAVWRSVLVSGNQSLRKLHDVIQAAMGWTNSHLHLYASADRKDIVSDPRFELDGARDEGRVKVRSFAPEVGHRFLYEYDLGDSWTHDVLVEEILLPEKAGRLPRCIGGERACPPEDCGGVSGFLDLIEAMRDPSHPRRDHYLEWLGRAFDPEAFDVGETNDRLRRLR